MPTFKLVSPEGDDLGSFRTCVPNWSPGDVIPRGAGESLRVERVLVRDGDELVLEVVPAEARRERPGGQSPWVAPPGSTSPRTLLRTPPVAPVETSRRSRRRTRRTPSPVLVTAVVLADESGLVQPGSPPGA